MTNALYFFKLYIDFKKCDRPMDFNTAEYTKHSYVFSDSTLQPTIKKLELVAFGYSIQRVCTAIKILLLFLTNLCDTGFS